MYNKYLYETNLEALSSYKRLIPRFGGLDHVVSETIENTDVHSSTTVESSGAKLRIIAHFIHSDILSTAISGFWYNLMCSIGLKVKKGMIFSGRISRPFGTSGDEIPSRSFESSRKVNRSRDIRFVVDIAENSEQKLSVDHDRSALV